MFVSENAHAILYDLNASSDRTVARIVDKIEPSKRPPSILAFDAGATNNSYAGVLLYKDGSELKVTSLIEIIPKQKKRIDFYLVYQNVIKPLIEKWNVKVVAYDRWNSYQVVDQIASDFNGEVKGIQYTLKAKDFSGFRDLALNASMELPKLETTPDRIEVTSDYKNDLANSPASHLYLQMLTAVEVGGVWYKGDGYTDDLLRALVLGATMAFNQKVVEYVSKFRVEERKEVSNRAVVLVAGKTNFSNANLI